MSLSEVKKFMVVENPVQGVSSKGQPFFVWEVMEEDGHQSRMFYFGSERKVPQLQKNKAYMIKVNEFGDNWAIERDQDGPKLVEELEQNPVEIIEYPEDAMVETRTIKELAVDQFRLYEYVMNKIIQPSDYAVVGGRKFLTKTGFKKLALAFNISDPELEITWLSDTEVQVKATAVAPNGRTSVDFAICSMSELYGEKTKHNLLTKAITRAKNRAISNLVGCGLVSFEEVEA